VEDGRKESAQHACLWPDSRFKATWNRWAGDADNMHQMGWAAAKNTPTATTNNTKQHINSVLASTGNSAYQGHDAVDPKPQTLNPTLPQGPPLSHYPTTVDRMRALGC
jgi:hypothetical protein